MREKIVPAVFLLLILGLMLLPFTALADSTQGQGAGQANGCGAGGGNTQQSANCGGAGGGAGGAGGSGGQGGTGISAAGAAAGAIAGAQSASLAGAQSGSTSSASLSNTSSNAASVNIEAAPAQRAVTTLKSAPDVFIGGPASGPCTGVSGGMSASWLGGGFGFNSATIDEACTLRENLRVLSMILPTLTGSDLAEARALVMVMIRGIKAPMKESQQ